MWAFPLTSIKPMIPVNADIATTVPQTSRDGQAQETTASPIFFDAEVHALLYPRRLIYSSHGVSLTTKTVSTGKTTVPPVPVAFRKYKMLCSPIMVTRPTLTLCFGRYGLEGFSPLALPQLGGFFRKSHQRYRFFMSVLIAPAP
jgi:hypothetical protein